MAFCDFEVIFEVLCVSRILCHNRGAEQSTLVKKKLLVILSTYICPLPIVPLADTICKGDNGDLGIWKGK